MSRFRIQWYGAQDSLSRYGLLHYLLLPLGRYSRDSTVNTIPLDFNMSFTSSLCSCVIDVRFPRSTALSILWACAMLGHITSHEQGRGRLSRSTGEWPGWTAGSRQRISLADYGCQELQELELSLPALDRGSDPLRKI